MKKNIDLCNNVIQYIKKIDFHEHLFKNKDFIYTDENGLYIESEFNDEHSIKHNIDIICKSLEKYWKYFINKEKIYKEDGNCHVEIYKRDSEWIFLLESNNSDFIFQLNYTFIEKIK